MTLRPLGAVVPPVLAKLEADLRAKGVDVGPAPFPKGEPPVNQHDIAARARVLLAEHFACPSEEVTDKARLHEDLGADSLDNIEIVIALEEEFNLEIGDDEAERWQTVADIMTALQAKLAVSA